LTFLFSVARRRAAHIEGSPGANILFSMTLKGSARELALGPVIYWPSSSFMNAEDFTSMDYFDFSGADDWLDLDNDFIVELSGPVDGNESPILHMNPMPSWPSKPESPPVQFHVKSGEFQSEGVRKRITVARGTGADAQKTSHYLTRDNGASLTFRRLNHRYGFVGKKIFRTVIDNIRASCPDDSRPELSNRTIKRAKGGLIS
jgi:hypothetical protein